MIFLLYHCGWSQSADVDLFELLLDLELSLALGLHHEEEIENDTEEAIDCKEDENRSRVAQYVLSKNREKSHHQRSRQPVYSCRVGNQSRLNYLRHILPSYRPDKSTEKQLTQE